MRTADATGTGFCWPTVGLSICFVIDMPDKQDGATTHKNMSEF
jgi:hypothetical protein